MEMLLSELVGGTVELFAKAANEIAHVIKARLGRNIKNGQVCL